MGRSCRSYQSGNSKNTGIILIGHKAVEAILNKSKKPQVRILEDHTFTIILGIKYKDLRTLITDGVYLFLGKGWLITIHSSDVDLKSNVHRLFEEKIRKLWEPQSVHYIIV
jgi:magnesium transporter